MIILLTSNSARNESNDVIVPAPAIIGKAIGTIEAVLGASFLKIVIPKIISKAKNRIIKAPATAKEFMSTPMILSISSPKNKKLIIIIAAIIEAFSDSIWPTFSRSEMMMGMLPTILMTAKRTMLAVKISLKSIIEDFFLQMYFHYYKCTF